MDRAYTSGAAGSPPSAPGSPSSGYPTAGNPGTGTPATKPGPWWYHMVTEEIRKVISDAGLTPDYTNLSQLSQAIQQLGVKKQIQPISASAASNALTVTFNPTSLDFRSATLTSGTVNTRAVASAISLTVAAGATLGTTSTVTNRHVVLAIDNAGTVELAIVNLAGGNALDETGVISTTALSGASNSANVIYSTTARTNVPYRVVGFVEGTWATAGQWSGPPALVQGIGGQALAALSSIGYGQTWQNLTGSRAGATTYYNTTGKPISISVTGYSSVNPDHAVLTINGTIVGRSNSQITGNGSGYYLYVTGIVPPGGSYNVAASSGALTIYLWSELR